MVTQIANRLVRTFGEGKYLRKVVSEVIDGKTFTNVFDGDGKLVVSRVKAITEKVVGDKLVKTKTCIEKFEDNDASKIVYDRVYKLADGIKELFGKRRVFKRLDGLNNSSKALFKGNSNEGIRTHYENGIRDSKTKLYMNDGYISSSCKSICHNNKGLPVPQGAVPEEMTELTLKEMRRQHYRTNPTVTYAPDGYNMKSLDDISDLGNIKLNDLADYL